MSNLATLFPQAQIVRRLPLTRDQLMLLLVATNELFLGIDTYLSHMISGTIVRNEWIPIIFGPVAGVLLLLAGLIATRQRTLASVIATVTLVGSMAVGVLGAYFHVVRGILPSAPPGQQVTLDLLIWAPPILGPLAFTLVGILGISAAWVEDPPDSGVLRLWGNTRLRLPLSKTRAYFCIVSLGTLISVVSSVLDHARLQFSDPWLWLPTVVGVFATAVALTLGAIERPTPSDLLTYLIAMVLLIGLGVLGAILHIQSNLTSTGVVVIERFIRGAPFLAPLLFANMGMMGLLVLLSPIEGRDRW